MKTAEEFFRQKLKEQSPSQEIVTLSSTIITVEQAMRWAHEYANLKTEFHVTAALRVIAEKDMSEITYWSGNPYSGEGSDYISEEKILNAYPLENIK